MPNSTILDNLERTKQIDKSGMLSACQAFPRYCKEAARLAETVSLDYPEPRTIIIGGMGGSAIGGELLKDCTRERIHVPIEVTREYSLPAYADKKTLAFIVSYSGETEESLSVFLDALKRGCMTFCIASGGTLLEQAEKLDVPHLRIPPRLIAPRAALPYLFLPMSIILERMGLLSDFKDEIPEAVGTLEKVSAENAPEKSANFSKTLALNINDTLPVVYGWGFYSAVAQRLKQQFNENSKIPSKWEYFPELNHNEIVGWEDTGKQAKNLSVILIRDRNEPKEIQTRIEATKDLIGVDKLFEIWSTGESTLAKMLSTVLVGDFVSVYLAILRGVDPTPVKTISLLKERMKQSERKEKTIHELQKLSAR